MFYIASSICVLALVVYCINVILMSRVDALNKRLSALQEDVSNLQKYNAWGK
jgi:dynactin complex subunit